MLPFVVPSLMLVAACLSHQPAGAGERGNHAHTEPGGWGWTGDRCKLESGINVGRRSETLPPRYLPPSRVHPRLTLQVEWFQGGKVRCVLGQAGRVDYFVRVCARAPSIDASPRIQAILVTTSSPEHLGTTNSHARRAPNHRTPCVDFRDRVLNTRNDSNLRSRAVAPRFRRA